MFTYKKSLKVYEEAVKKEGLETVVKLDLVHNWRGEVPIGISLEVEGEENYNRVKEIFRELRKKNSNLKGDFWGRYYDDEKNPKVDLWD